MNPIVIFAAAWIGLAAVSMATAAPTDTSDKCFPTSKKPILDSPATDTDDWDTKLSKMFRGYVQTEHNGETFYLPLNLITRRAADSGKSIVDSSALHTWDTTLVTECGSINLDVTKSEPVVEIRYHFHNMTYNFGGEMESCNLVEVESKDGHAYACETSAEGSDENTRISTLVIQRMELDKFLPTELPPKYNVLWESAEAPDEIECMPTDIKPILDNPATERDDWNTSFSKMFRGYVQTEQDGKPIYLPLNLVTRHAADSGESITNPSEPHTWDTTLVTECGSISLEVTKTRPKVEIRYNFHNMTYNFGGEPESCSLVKTESAEGHAYACEAAAEGSGEKKRISTLVIQRMELDKFLPTKLPFRYNISWE